MSFLEKYKPTNLQQVIGNKTAIQSLSNWLQTWPAVSTAVLVSGSCGIGKTLTIDLLVKSHTNPGYNVMEINPDDDRTDSYLQKNVKPFTKAKRTMWGQLNIMTVNDIDCCNDHGFVGALGTILKETKIPIILTCNNRYEPKIKTLAALCTDVKFFKPSAVDISKYITEIVKRELNTPRLTSIQTQTIQAAAEKADGDIRNAIMTTEFNLISATHPNNNKRKLENDKDQTKTNLFEMTTEFMSQMTDYAEKADLLAMEKELLPLMVHENYALNLIKTKTPLEKLVHLSFAAARMSDYDLFPYEGGLSSVIQVTQVTHVTTKVNFTGYLGKMSTKTKKTNVTTELETRVHHSGVGGRQTIFPVGHLRLDYMSYMLLILYNKITEPSMFLDKCVSFGLTKEDIQENLGVLLIPEGIYCRCDYSAVDKKVKASLTKLFTKHTTTATTSASAAATTPPTKKSKTTSSPSAAKEKKKSTPAPKKTKQTTTTLPPSATVTAPMVVDPERATLPSPSPPPPVPNITMEVVAVVETKEEPILKTKTVVKPRTTKTTTAPATVPALAVDLPPPPPVPKTRTVVKPRTSKTSAATTTENK